MTQAWPFCYISTNERRQYLYNCHSDYDIEHDKPCVFVILLISSFIFIFILPHLGFICFFGGGRGSGIVHSTQVLCH
jgi:hypothetical protein